jgi:hypothetical protein
MELVDVNGETGLLVRVDGRILGIMAIESDGERIHAVYAVVNPTSFRRFQKADRRLSHVEPSLRLRL